MGSRKRAGRSPSGRTLQIAAGLVCAVMLSSCGKDQDTPEVSAPLSQSQPQPVRSPGFGGDGLSRPEVFKIHFASDCGSQNRDSCQGGYGLSLDEEGLYQIGPGPEGQIETGHLTAEEMIRFSKVMKGMKLAMSEEEEEICVEEADPAVSQTPGGNESITLQRNGVLISVLMRSSPKSVCYRGMTARDAGEFRGFIRSIVSNHYPVPFPDRCQSSLEAFREIESPLQGCTVDADCTYVGDDFRPLAVENFHLVNMTSCHLIQAPVVANREFLVLNHEKVLLAYNQVWNQCGSKKLTREECAAASGFRVVADAPKCRQNVCVPADPARTQ